MNNKKLPILLKIKKEKIKTRNYIKKKIIYKFIKNKIKEYELNDIVFPMDIILFLIKEYKEIDNLKKQIEILLNKIYNIRKHNLINEINNEIANKFNIYYKTNKYTAKKYNIIKWKTPFIVNKSMINLLSNSKP